MKFPAVAAASLALLAAFAPGGLRAQVAIQGDAVEIFDEGMFGDGNEVEIVNGAIVVKSGAGQKKEPAAPPDPAGDNVLELTDDSRLHGRLVSLGKSELVWERGDTKGVLIFFPQEVRRIVFGGAPAAAELKANATLKLQGGDWISGDLSGFESGKFQMHLGGAANVEVDRGRVEWIYLAPSRPPDAYEGPIGPLGLAGWDTGGTAGSGWDYADGALVARAATPIVRRFEFLPERMELEFTASDGGAAIRGLTLWLQPGTMTRGYAKGSVYLRFQANNVTANSYDGQNMKNFSANLQEEKGAPKQTRYRILQDRRAGKLIIFMNGRKIADWVLPEIKDAGQGGSISWQPSYWSSNMSWTLSRVRVQPWDGSLEADEPDKDLLSTGTPGKQAGTLEGAGRESVKFSGKEFARKEPLFIRMARDGAVEVPPAAVARVWLAQRGEFDVTGLGIRDGTLTVRTSFCGEMTLPMSAIRSIEFPHRLTAAERLAADGGDALIFKNGDELRGSLVSVGEGQALKWKPVQGDRQVEFGIGRLAGVLLAPSRRKPDSAGGTAVRFQNGDWLAGDLRLLDGQHLRLKSSLAENLQFDRSAIRTLYFGPAGEVPVWDGAGDHALWMQGTATPDGPRAPRTKKDELAKKTPWRYFDGSFSLLRAGNRGGYNNAPNLGRRFEGLQDKVEISFELSTPKGPAGYAIQLFTEENRPGLMIQGGWDSAYIYDMSPRKQGGVFFNQPQQAEFGEKIGPEGNRRQFRFLADRKTGRLAMFVNGQLVTQFGQRPGKESPKPGKGITIVPQPMNSTVTVSNLWIAPWGGALPELPKKDLTKDPKAPAESKEKPRPDPAAAEAPAPPGPDVVALVNGDETSGIVEGATPEALHLKCDVGNLEIPIKRTLLVEFGGVPAPPSPGIRLRLAGKGQLTVQSFKLADGQVSCRSTTAGDLSFPISALSEIVFQPRGESPPVSSGPNDARNNPVGGAIQGGMIIRGGGALQLNGGAIIIK